MAGIATAQLTYTKNAPKQTVGVQVAGRVAFSAYELDQMRNHGLKFRLECRLIGVDHIAGTEEGSDKASNVRFVFPHKYFPDATPNTWESFNFDATLGYSALNEDFGLDEIQATVVLVNCATQARVFRASNMIQDNFQPVGPS